MCNYPAKSWNVEPLQLAQCSPPPARPICHNDVGKRPSEPKQVRSLTWHRPQAEAPSPALYLPGSHGAHVVDCSDEAAVPATHDKHWLRPEFSWNFPTAHGEHTVEPLLAAYLASAQAMHATSLLASANLPTTQSAHCVLEDWAPKRPATHGVHSVLRLNSLYVPAASAKRANEPGETQSREQADAPGHTRQATAFAFAAKRPGTQSTHSEAPDADW
jgi:hypothetical protein